MIWQDPRLAYDPITVGYPEDYVLGDYTKQPRLVYQGDFKVKEIFEGWRPHLVILNGIGDRVKTNVVIGIWPDGRVAYGETFYAKVETPMDLRLFPFDRQKLKIFFHPFVNDRETIILVPDDRLAGTWSQDKGIAEWTRNNVSNQEQAGEIVRFDGSRKIVSEYVVTVDIKRKPMHFIISIIFPLILLVALSWCVFWMDEESLSNRISISFIGILSVVAYYFVIQDSIPRISYLTLTDVFIILTFIILTASVLVSIIVDKLNRAGRKNIGDKLDYISRWAFPTSYVVISLLIGLLFVTFN